MEKRLQGKNRWNIPEITLVINELGNLVKEPELLDHTFKKFKYIFD